RGISTELRCAFTNSQANCTADIRATPIATAALHKSDSENVGTTARESITVKLITFIQYRPRSRIKAEKGIVTVRCWREYVGSVVQPGTDFLGFSRHACSLCSRIISAILKSVRFSVQFSDYPGVPVRVTSEQRLKQRRRYTSQIVRMLALQVEKVWYKLITAIQYRPRSRIKEDKGFDTLLARICG
ncbi:hypothetical protein J6590_059448, partial [Homalodisca vitripennis]